MFLFILFNQSLNKKKSQSFKKMSKGYDKYPFWRLPNSSCRKYSNDFGDCNTEFSESSCDDHDYDMRHLCEDEVYECCPDISDPCESSCDTDVHATYLDDHHGKKKKKKHKIHLKYCNDGDYERHAWYVNHYRKPSFTLIRGKIYFFKVDESGYKYGKIYFYFSEDEAGDRVIYRSKQLWCGN